MIKALKIFAIYMVIFNQMLDTSIANLALTTISADLYMDVYHASWIMTSFGTGLVISFSLGNLIKPYLSNDSMLAVGCVVFIYASYFCGNAQNSTEFLIFRFLQGLSSGLAVIVSQSILLSIMGENQKAFAVALWTSAISLAPVCGPFLGAFITEYLSWRWLFLINVPLMTLSMIILLPKMTLVYTKQKQTNYGKLTTLLCFSIGITAMQYMVDFGELYNWFDSPNIVTSGVLSLCFGIGFLLINKRYPLFDFGVFKNKSYASATAILCVGNGLIFASLVFLPVWLQNVYGMPILQAGLVIAIASGVAAVATPIIGKRLPKEFFASAAAVSLLLTAGSFLMMSRNSIDVSQDYLIISRLVAGLGLAIFTMPLAALSLSTIKPDEMINANSVSVMLRILCANLFITIGFMATTYQMRVDYNTALSSIDRGSILQAFEQSSMIPYVYQIKISATNAINSIFLVMAIIFFVFALVILPLVVKQYVSSKANSEATLK